MQAPEETLRRLSHALKLCFNRSRKRAEGIVELSYDIYVENYVSEGKEFHEANQAAELAFWDDLDRAEEALTWRALVVADRVGRAMCDYVLAHDEEFSLDPWIDWRRSAGDEPASRFVHSLADDEFFCLRVALHVRAVLNLGQQSPRIPTDGDINHIAPYVETEVAHSWPEWFEILGEPPKEIRYSHLLQMAGTAARRDIDSEALARESREQLDRMEETLRDVKTLHAEALARQNAIINQLERMVLHMESTDLHACEQSLLTELPGVYEKLTPEVRSLLKASEQTYRIKGFAAPVQIVHGLATAFELQLKHTVISGLFHHLKDQGVKDLSLPRQRPGAEGRLLWKPFFEADKCTLGEMSLILRHPHPAIEECLGQYGQDRAGIQSAIESVSNHRNSAAHGVSFDIGTAEAIRSDWFHWGKRPGGIFSVFFRNE